MRSAHDAPRAVPGGGDVSCPITLSDLALFYYASIADLPNIVCFLLAWLLCTAFHAWTTEKDVDAPADD